MDVSQYPMGSSHNMCVWERRLLYCVPVSLLLLPPFLKVFVVNASVFNVDQSIGHSWFKFLFLFYFSVKCGRTVKLEHGFTPLSYCSLVVTILFSLGSRTEFMD